MQMRAVCVYTVPPDTVLRVHDANAHPLRVPRCKCGRGTIYTNMSPTTTSPPAAYVVGLLFNESLTWVLLIRKNKPAWQAGKLNGVGGKVEDGETPAQAMEREFMEEAGTIVPDGWQHYMTMRGANPDGGHFVVDFFAARFEGDLGAIRSQEAEKLEVVGLADIHLMRSDMVENLAWSVGLALDVLQDQRPSFATVQYGAPAATDTLPPVYPVTNVPAVPPIPVPEEVRAWVDSHKGMRTPTHMPECFEAYSTSLSEERSGFPLGGTPVGGYLVAVCQPSPRDIGGDLFLYDWKAVDPQPS